MTSNTARDLYADRRGAVMVTGLVMSCFLIGALWFIIGVGDAIVFRDKMQEAADHGAFTAAALNAKGMNFIALMNLIMVAATVIYLILGIVSDILGAIHTACLVSAIGGDVECAAGCVLDWATDHFFGDCPTWDAWNGAFKIWDLYYKGYSKGLVVLYDLEKVATYVYPLAGTAEAYKVGEKYHDDPKNRHGSVDVLALSSSEIPGAAVKGVFSGAKKEGLLPVEPKKRKDLCKKVVTVATNAGLNLIGAGQSVSSSNFLGAAMGFLNSIIGSILQERYCNPNALPGIGAIQDYSPQEIIFPWPLSGMGAGTNNKFWDENGFYVVYGAAKNGNVWFQTWAMTINPTLRDDSESKVAIASKKPSLATKYSQTESSAYFAQSEMYFDCDADWNSAACNFEDNALFAIKWRARLRKLDYPQLASGFASTALNSIQNGAPGGTIAKAGGLPGALAKVFANGKVGQTALTQVFTVIQKNVNSWIVKQAGNFNPSLQGVYH